MYKYNIIGVDLAKHVIQVSVMNAVGKEVFNRSFNRMKFAGFLSKQKKPSLVAFEACGSSHHWARKAQSF